MNDKTKAQFFAQYFGVEDIAFGDGYERAFPVSTITLNSEYEYLLLRSVEQLEDSEHIEIGKLYYRQMNLSEARLLDAEYKREGQVISGGLQKRHALACCTTTAVFQYLLRIGVLLPFTYLNTDNKPVTLSPADIVNLGWAKINTL